MYHFQGKNNCSQSLQLRYNQADPNKLSSEKCLNKLHFPKVNHFLYSMCIQVKTDQFP